MVIKKILFLSAMLFSGILAHAVDYPYLTFVSSDGTIISLSVSSLEMTTSNGVMTVTNADGQETFTLTDLTTMYFSTTDETNSTSTKKACGLAFSSTTATAKMGESFTEPTLTNPYSVTVTWSSSNESVATVDDSGNVTLVAAGTTVITASFAGNDDYEAGSASYTLTVEEATPTGVGTLDAEDGEVEVYAMSGKLMGRYASAKEARTALKKGYYIFVKGDKKYKIVIK